MSTAALIIRIITGVIFLYLIYLGYKYNKIAVKYDYGGLPEDEHPKDLTSKMVIVFIAIIFDIVFFIQGDDFEAWIITIPVFLVMGPILYLVLKSNGPD